MWRKTEVTRAPTLADASMVTIVTKRMRLESMYLFRKNARMAVALVAEVGKPQPAVRGCLLAGNGSRETARQN